MKNNTTYYLGMPIYVMRIQKEALEFKIVVTLGGAWNGRRMGTGMDTSRV